jgi:hypothetical protein
VYVIVFVPGLVYKKGKFSVSEELQLKDAIENYRIVGQVLLLVDTFNRNTVLVQATHLRTTQ